MWYYFQKLIQIQRKNTLVILIKVRKIFAYDIFRKWIYLKILLSEKFPFSKEYKTRKQRFSQLETQNIHFWKNIYFFDFSSEKSPSVEKGAFNLRNQLWQRGWYFDKMKVSEKKDAQSRKSWKKVFSAIIKEIYSSVPQDQKCL